LPEGPARREIFKVHLSKRSIGLSEHEVEQLVRDSEGFSGAEIEAAVVGAIYRAFAANRPLAGPDIGAEMAATVPLSTSRAEDVLALRWPISVNQACGARAINGLVVAAVERGLQASLLDLRSSGDTAGDRSRVVGYGAFAFAEPH